MHGLTAIPDPGILLVAAVHAKPLEAPPQPELNVRQRGEYSRMRIVVLASSRRAAGGWPVVYPGEN